MQSSTRPAPCQARCRTRTPNTAAARPLPRSCAPRSQRPKEHPPCQLLASGAASSVTEVAVRTRAAFVSRHSRATVSAPPAALGHARRSAASHPPRARHRGSALVHHVPWPPPPVHHENAVQKPRQGLEGVRGREHPPLSVSMVSGTESDLTRPKSPRLDANAARRKLGGMILAAMSDPSSLGGASLRRPGTPGACGSRACLPCP